MSRIGKEPIKIPAGIQVTVSKGNLVTVKGNKHELFQQVNSDITIRIENDTIYLERPTDQRRHRSLHGLYRTLIANMIEGISKGYKIQQELVGVGYKANALNPGVLELTIGYSHDYVIKMPPEIKVSTEAPKGKPPVITLESYDKEILGMIAAKIRSLRKPEPYKGKGIRYMGEKIRRKAGKTASAK
jgi:large subunit ribosomal protein L6